MNCCFLQELRLQPETRERGEPSAGELGQVMVKIRSRSKSVQVVRSPELCLLERLAQLGLGARAAGERRRVVQGLEEAKRRQV